MSGLVSPGWSTYEELEALTDPFWKRVQRVGKELVALQREAELELSRWEDDGGQVGEMPTAWRDTALGLVRELGRRHGN